MKVSCKQSNLAKALGSVSRMVGSTTTLPVLANVLLQTDKNRLKLSATNLEVGINYWVGAKVEEEGKVTAPARLMADFASNLPEDAIEISTDKNNLKLSTKNYQSNLNGIDPEEFPSIPEVKASNVIKLDTEEFRQAISQVAFVASTDEARPVLGGIYIYNQSSKLYLVATDSYRLAEKVIKLKSTPKNKINLIVPARTMQELLRMLDGEQESLELLFDDSQAMFRFGDIELISRLIDGQFPNYRELIPGDEGTAIKIGTEELANLAKVTGLFAQGNAGSVSISVDSKKKKLKMNSIASQVGENTSEASVEVKGGDAEVSVNSRYLNEALAAVEAEKVNFAITGKINPCVLRPEGQTDYVHIIMPLRA